MRLALFALVPISVAAGFALFWSGHDGRPSTTEAAAYFESQFPALELIATELSENEVVACSFVFRYKKEGAGAIHSTEIQFMADAESGIWRPYPSR